MEHFLSVITRTFKRPKMFKVNRQALKMQTCQDYEAIVLKDLKGIGVAETHAQFHTLDVKGDYVWIYDDDTVLVDDTFIEKLKALALDMHPDVIIAKALVTNMIFPDGWPPTEGKIDTANIIVSRDVWLKHRTDWPVALGGDFAFINAILKTDPVVCWLDVLASKTIRISQGMREEHDFELPPDVLARDVKQVVEKAIKQQRYLEPGIKVRIRESCASNDFSYQPGDWLTVTLDNIDHIEGLVRGGLAEKMPEGFQSEEK